MYMTVGGVNYQNVGQCLRREVAGHNLIKGLLCVRIKYLKNQTNTWNKGLTIFSSTQNFATSTCTTYPKPHLILLAILLPT